MTNEERQQAIEWLKCRPVMMAGAKRMYDLAVEALEAYVPDKQPEMTDEQFKDYCRKRCLSVVTNEFMEDVRKMVPTVQPEITRSIGKLVGYTDKPCLNCGRLRVERYESGLEICEKCNWCEQTKSYWFDGV